VNIDHSPRCASCAHQLSGSAARGPAANSRRRRHHAASAEDRRHIKDADVIHRAATAHAHEPGGGVTQEMIAFAAASSRPTSALVPEKRTEVTTEAASTCCATLRSAGGGAPVAGEGIRVSLFIDADERRSPPRHIGAPVIELHTDVMPMPRAPHNWPSWNASRPACASALRGLKGTPATACITRCAGHRRDSRDRQLNIGHATSPTRLPGWENAVRR